MTTEFREAFAMQCAAIGFDGASLYVAHPMQNRTTAELHQQADEAFGAIVASLTLALFEATVFGLVQITTPLEAHTGAPWAERRCM